jgi:hypothetical protein
MVASVIEPDQARAPHRVDPARRLRSGAWLLQRSWRHPQRLPAGWRSERFATAVDHARDQLRPIRSLTALTDSFGREALHLVDEDGRADTSPLEVAYATRWIALHAGSDLRGWRIHCPGSKR